MMAVTLQISFKFIAADFIRVETKEVGNFTRKSLAIFVGKRRTNLVKDSFTTKLKN